MHNKTEDPLRILIRDLIKEDYGFGSGGDYAGLGIDPMAGMPGGAHYADGDALYKVFIKPFVDVVGVAAGKTKELSQRAITTAKVAFETIMTTLLPALTDDYGKIFAEERQELQRIRQEYSQVYSTVWEAFGDSDIMIAAFMYRPDLFLTVEFAKKAPKVAAKLLSILSGGSLDRLLSGIFKGGVSEVRAARGHVLLEDDDKRTTRLASAIMRMASNDQVRGALRQSSEVAKLSKVGQELVRKTLKEAYERAAKVMSAKSIKDLERIAGKQIAGSEKLDSAPLQERQAIEKAVLLAAKKSMKAFYVKALQAQVNSALESGVADDHPYVKDHLRIIQKISQL